MSRPATPAPTVPTSRSQKRFEDKGYPCEWPELYRPGGFHPIQFGDCMNDGQYRVIRKLGYGSFSTVWLAANREHPRYVAVKVMRANHSTVDATASELEISSALSQNAEGSRGSDRVLKLLDCFKQRGPNGEHTCLVYEPMAGAVASMIPNLPAEVGLDQGQNDQERYPKWMARRILKDALLGLSFIHAHGIVHGDFQPGKLLFATRGLNDVDEARLAQDITASTTSLDRLDGKRDLWAPSYLALGQPLHEYADLRTMEAGIKLSDFGAAFFADIPPAKIVTPVALRAPETILGQQVDEKIDIWSFGCLIYELLTGTSLFSVVMYQGDSQAETDDDHLLELNDILGDLPSDIMEAWPRASDWFGPNRERLNPRATKKGQDADGLQDLHNEDGKSAGARDIADDEELFINDSLEVLFENNKPQDIDAAEAAIVTSLIRRILRYKASERPSAEEILKEKWFEDA